MSTTIHVDGPLSAGPPYVFASFDEFSTVLHVLVWVVFELSLVAACAAMVVVAFSGCRDSCGPSWEARLVPLALVVSFVTGASGLAAWAAGPGVGLLTLGTVAGLVVAVGWYIARRERRTTAALLTAVCGQSGGEQS
jgi:hypothetical protein